MIRAEIVLKSQYNCAISYKYNHSIMSSLYSLMELSDKQFGQHLHNHGYKYEEKWTYKLFSFSLHFKDAEFKKDTINITPLTTIKLIVSGKKEIIDLVLRGADHIRTISLEAQTFEVDSINNLRKIVFNKVMKYKLNSPCIESTIEEDKRIYLDIYNPKYYENLGNNLKKKYELIFGKPYEGELYFDIDDCLQVKNKSIYIKGGYLQGQVFNIWIEAEPEMQKIAYYCGLGLHNSLGAGFLTALAINA